jgi:hypothetical protein
MRKALTIALALCLAASSLPGCIFSPIHPDRRQVSKWNFEHFSGINDVRDVPGTIFGAVMIPVAWVVDAVIVNPIDSYKGAFVDTHKHAWDDEAEGEQQAFVKSYPRSLGAFWLLGPIDFIVRANAPVGPHDPAEWKEMWNKHVEVTSAE